MNNTYPYCHLALILIFSALIAMVSPAQSSVAFGDERGVITPAPGSLERRGILDAMRVSLRELHQLDAVFVVREMKVRGGWAWVHTLPQSRDGRARYEDFFALLRKERGSWTVAEIPCTEPDSSDCIDSPDFFRKLLERFPGLPASILPVE